MTEATIVIKGRNELSSAVKSAESSLKGLLKQGELLGKLFRGGAIAGAFYAFERLAESAEKAANEVGDQGTARSLRQLNREIDLLKAKGTNVIGKVLGNVYGGLFGDREAQLSEQIDFLKRMQGRSFTAVGYDDIGTGFFTAAEGAQKLLELEQKLALYQKNRPASERTRAPGSRSGGRSVVLEDLPKVAAATQAADEELWVLTDDTILALRAWNELGESSGDAMEQIGRDLSALNQEALDNLVAPLEIAKSEWSVFAEEAGRNLQNQFAQFLFDPFEDGLKGMLQGFADMLRQMLAQLAAQELLRAFFSWGAGLGGGVGQFFTDLGASFGGARAAGGAVAAGRSYLVGERGPELFVPGASGAILPNGMGGGAVVVNNYVTINDETDLKRSLPAILAETTRQSVAATKAEIRGDMKRYGKIR